MNTQKSVETLQFFITNLNAQSFSHKLQAKIFGSKGFSKLESKYKDHSAEEGKYVDQFISRLLDLGGTLKQEEVSEQKLYENPVDYIKADHEVSVEGIEYLRNCMEAIKEDTTTFEIFKEYLKDEEEDMFWQEQQLQLIDCIGIQNWIMKVAI